MNEEEVLVGRIQDLAEQCYHRDVPSHTEFLTLAEQDLFYRTVNKILGVRYVLSGGYEAAERKAALFLPSYAEDGDASMLPIAVVRISPLNEKFADALSHRDFLGSLMNLGVERYKLGDILIDGNQAYLICMADMADYICAELKKVRHTSVYCEVEAGLPEELTEPKTERKEGSVASVRLDAVLSLAFSSSRSKMGPMLAAADRGRPSVYQRKAGDIAECVIKRGRSRDRAPYGKIPLCGRAEPDEKGKAVRGC